MHFAMLAAALPLLFAVTCGAPTSDPEAPLPAAKLEPQKKVWEECGNWMDADNKPQSIPPPTCAQLYYNLALKLDLKLSMNSERCDDRNRQHHPVVKARGIDLPPRLRLYETPKPMRCGNWTTSWEDQHPIPDRVCYDLAGKEPEWMDEYDIWNPMPKGDRIGERGAKENAHRRHRRHPAAPSTDPAASEDDASPESKHEPDQVQHKQDAASPKADPHHGWVITKTRHCGNWTDDHGASHEITSDDCEMMQEDLDEAEEETRRIVAASLAVLLPPQADDDEAAKEGAMEQ